jgi:hypothetical protein
MSRRNKDKGRLPPFVPLLKDTIASAAWRAMSPSARCVYIALKQRYSSNFKNNGRLYLSVRQAAKEVGVNKDTAARCFQEIRHYGFGVITSGACLGVDGKGKAPHWRLTEVGYMADPPTRDFLSWNGTPFPASKNRTPSEKFGRSVRKTRTVASEKPGQLPAEVSEKFGHSTGHECPKNSDITSLTTWVARAGSNQDGARGSESDEPGEQHTGSSSFQSGQKGGVRLEIGHLLSEEERRNQKTDLRSQEIRQQSKIIRRLYHPPS